MSFNSIANKNKSTGPARCLARGTHRLRYQRIPIPADGGCLRKILMLAAGTTVVLLLVACGGHADSPPVPDLVPIGDGLKVVAYAVIAAAVIVVLGKLLP